MKALTGNEPVSAGQPQKGSSMRLVTTPYPKRRLKRNVRDLIELAPGDKRLRFRNIERDREVLRLWKKGVPLAKITGLFSISSRTMFRIRETFEAHLVDYKAFIASEMAKTPEPKPRLTPRYYFNSCRKCLTGTMLGREKSDTNSYEFDCLSCGYNISLPPLKLTRREENWNYEKANRHSYSS